MTKQIKKDLYIKKSQEEQYKNKICFHFKLTLQIKNNFQKKKSIQEALFQKNKYIELLKSREQRRQRKIQKNKKGILERTTGNLKINGKNKNIKNR